MQAPFEYCDTHIEVLDCATRKGERHDRTGRCSPSAACRDRQLGERRRKQGMPDDHQCDRSCASSRNGQCRYGERPAGSKNSPAALTHNCSCLQSRVLAVAQQEQAYLFSQSLIAGYVEPNSMPIRAPRVIPGDVPGHSAARRLGLTEEEFQVQLPQLVARGFPAADPDTGLFDLDAIDAWRRARYPHLFGATMPTSAADARTGVVRGRIRSLRHRD